MSEELVVLYSPGGGKVTVGKSIKAALMKFGFKEASAKPGTTGRTPAKKATPPAATE